jgi:hypothetical protein
MMGRTKNGEKVKIIMVMGVQRSGTNVLRESFGKDPAINDFNESADSELFQDWKLRPEKEIRPVLQRLGGPILTKPISETKFRSIDDVMKEFCDYDVWISWIYRDPINVYYSQIIKWEMVKNRGVDSFINDWNRRNQSILAALQSYSSKIAIVQYENLISHPELFRGLCSFFGINGKYLFRGDSLGGLKNLSDEMKAKITRGTADILTELNRRSFAVKAEKGN